MLALKSKLYERNRAIEMSPGLILSFQAISQAVSKRIIPFKQPSLRVFQFFLSIELEV